MNTYLKKAALLLAILALLAAAYAVYEWNKPARDAKYEEGIAVQAHALFEAYASNQQAADSLYLDKTIIVSGTILKTGANQQGQPYVELKTASENGTIFCTLKQANALKPLQQVSLKGICKGYRDQLLFSDVVLTDCYLIPPSK